MSQWLGCIIPETFWRPTYMADGGLSCRRLFVGTDRALATPKNLTLSLAFQHMERERFSLLQQNHK